MNHKPFEVSPPFLENPPPTDNYQAKVWHFCNQWQQGQQNFVIRTSGSTGTPKPITLQRTQLQASAKLTGTTFGLQKGDAALVCLHVDYIAGMMMLVRGLELGLKLTVIEPSSNPLEDFDNTVAFDFMAFVPLQIQQILTENPEKVQILNRAKAILIGGAGVSHPLHQQLQAIQAPVVATYGMTETVSHIAIRYLNGPHQQDVFTVLEGVTIGTDARNCLYIEAESTNFERVQTNDVVELLDSQAFRLIGRFDNIINSGGVKIQLEKVENSLSNVLAMHRRSERFFAFGEPDPTLGERLVVFIETSTRWDDALKTQIQADLLKFLNRFEQPKDFYFCRNFLETPTGKIDKKATFAQKHTLFTHEYLTSK
ncbi:MAG: AMP-binding protein [Spirosomataceae bacterium]